MVLDEFNLEGKVAIVTGGGTGLGRAMALAIARAGADLVVAARRKELIERTAADARGVGREALAIPTDVTSSHQVERMVESALSHFGKVDILVNNAGGNAPGMGKLPLDITDEEWRVAMDINLSGTFFCCRAVGRHMVARSRGKIINIASGWGLRGGRDLLVYCTAKAGVVNLTRVLAMAWGQYGINVNCIAPGQLPQQPVTSPEEQKSRELRGSRIPIGRLGEGREIGPLAVFLASDASNYMTGQIVGIDGGTLAGGYAPIDYTPVIAI